MQGKVAVLGGGVAGVTAANELRTRGFDVDLIERGSGLGGLHRTVQIEGLTFDIGTFLFNTKHELIKTFPFLASSFVPIKPKRISITPSGNIDTYPLSVRGYMRDNGLGIFCYSLADLVYSRIRHHRRDTVPAYAHYYMGSVIYKRSGLKNYIERLYQMKDDELGLDFAKQRLHNLADHTPSKILSTKLVRSWKRSTGTVLNRNLVRPVAGFDYVYEQIRDHLREHGVTVHLNSTIKAVKRCGAGFELTRDSETVYYDRIISTIPTPIMLRLIGEQPEGNMDHMALYSMFYVGRLTYRASIIYNFTLHGFWKRITVFSSYYGQHQGQDYLTVEATTQDISERALAALRHDFEQHALHYGLFLEPPQFMGATVTERAYPIFRGGESDRLLREKSKLSTFGIDFVGRQGNFEYLSSHETAARAKKLVNELDTGD